MSTGTAITIDDVSHVFAGGVRALEPIELEVGAGEFVAIVGPSGCGKSTLFNAVAGLIRPTTGRVLLGGRDVTGQTGLVGYMLQKDLLLPWRSVLDNVLLGRRIRGGGKGADRAEALGLLHRYGLEEFADHYPHALSGGMRQRAALMRTLLFSREVLLLDEPFGALDSQTRLLMQEWLLGVWAEFGSTILFITHDVDEAIYLADRVVVLSARPGRIKGIFQVPFARPRPHELVTADAFAALKREVFGLIYEESLRAAHERGAIPGLAVNDQRPRSLVAIVLPPVIVFALLFVGWELLVRVRDVQGFVLPSPSAVLDALDHDRSRLFEAAVVTTKEILLGFAIGAGLGFALATLMAHSRLAERGLYPLLITTQTVPPIAIAAPLVIWLGYDIWPKVIITALIVFFPVLVNSFQGLSQVDRDLVSLMRSMGASWWQTYWRVRVPAASTLVFAALKLAATYSVIGAIFGEWVGADDGLGVYILEVNSRLQTDRVYAAIFVLSAIGIAMFLAVALAEWFATPWRRRATVRRWRRPRPAAPQAGPVSQGGLVR